jgi:general secretion pathway protein G
MKPRVHRHRRGLRRDRRAWGFTLVELMFAVAVVAVLSTLAIGQLTGYVDRSKSAAARADIALMEMQILRYRNNNDGALPQSLAQIGNSTLLDPWQRPYHYTRLAGVKGSKGSARKDKKLNPLNSDYDLFSAGKDGVFKAQVSQKDSLDDVIRARDGAYIGLAADF